MQTYKITLEYDGTDFGGFQIQNNARTVQGVLEKALEKVFQHKTKVIGASRTDSGVHAEGQVAHFKTAKKIPLQNLLRAINSHLPPDVALKKIQKAPSRFHARYSAKKKIYIYSLRLSRNPSPLERRSTYDYFYAVDVSKMRKAARLVKGRHDFKSFQAKSSEREMSTVRTLSKIRVARNKERLVLLFEGNGFLYNMVRNIVGSLLEVGRGKMTLADFKRAFRARDRRQMGPTAPAKGLTLKQIVY